MMTKKYFKTGFILLFLLGIISLACAQTLGDVNNNGNIDIVDALMIAQYAVGGSPQGFTAAAADANADGTINIVDALVVAQFAVGLITALPPGSVVPVNNPFTGVKWYVNQEWAARAGTGSGAAIAGYNTAVWFENVASLTNGIGLKGHLDAALEQQAGLILLVLRNLPDCMQPGPDEIIIADPWMAKYKAEFIDPVAAILANTAYRKLRIAVILEPDRLPGLVTNLSIARCQEMNSSGEYVNGIQYALNKLTPLPNVYIYLDIAHSGWLGWDTNFTAAVALYTNCVKGAASGLNSIEGFITNTGYYSPLEEPFLPDPNLMIGDTMVKSSQFYEWNPYFGELEYAQDMYTAFVEKGFPSSIGMLIDTSRNGWGGGNRPVKVSTATDVETYVTESRIDRRTHRGNWCNIKSAGIGARPVANPAVNIDAFVWAYPPGISDGISVPGPVDPNNPENFFTQMCDPNGKSVYNPGYGTDAIQQAPHRGYWNQAHFDILLQNAYPPVK